MGKHIHEELIVDYVLGNLSAKKYFTIAAHLSSCHTCTNLYQHWEQVLETEAVAPPPTSFWHRMLAHIKSWQDQTKYKRIYLTGSFIAVFLVFIVYSHLSNHYQVDEQVLEPMPIEQIQNQATSLHVENVEQDVFAAQVAYFYEDLQQNISIQKPHMLSKPVAIHSIDSLSTLDNVQLIRWLEVPSSFPEQIFILNDGSMCSYHRDSSQLICVKMGKDPSRNKYFPIQSKSFNFNRPYFLTH